MTVVGIVVPGRWTELTPDDFLRLMDQAGDAGRVSTTTLSAAASESRAIGVTEHVALNSAGKLKFLWNYFYEVRLRGRLMTVPLAVCQVDVVTVLQNPPSSSPDDDEELLGMERELARAWMVRDHSALDRILALEWSVTTPEGDKLFRAAVLAATFDSRTSASNATAPGRSWPLTKPSPAVAGPQEGPQADRIVRQSILRALSSVG
jgi:hypothetical protein